MPFQLDRAYIHVLYYHTSSEGAGVYFFEIEYIELNIFLSSNLKIFFLYYLVSFLILLYFNS